MGFRLSTIKPCHDCLLLFSYELNELQSDGKYEQQHKTKNNNIRTHPPNHQTHFYCYCYCYCFFIVVLSLSIPLVDATRKVKTVTVKQSSESCHPHHELCLLQTNSLLPVRIVEMIKTSNSLVKSLTLEVVRAVT